VCVTGALRNGPLLTGIALYAILGYDMVQQHPMNGDTASNPMTGQLALYSTAFLWTFPLPPLHLAFISYPINELLWLAPVIQIFEEP